MFMCFCSQIEQNLIIYAVALKTYYYKLIISITEVPDQSLPWSVLLNGNLYLSFSP